VHFYKYFKIFSVLNEFGSFHFSIHFFCLHIILLIHVNKHVPKFLLQTNWEDQWKKYLISLNTILEGGVHVSKLKWSRRGMTITRVWRGEERPIAHHNQGTITFWNHYVSNEQSAINVVSGNLETGCSNMTMHLFTGLFLYGNSWWGMVQCASTNPDRVCADYFYQE
jgi:hypothetical protein